MGVNIFWFRRDLRLDDNAGLFFALSQSKPVVPVFIFDTNILNELEDKDDKRVMFIHQALSQIQEELVRSGSTLDIRIGDPLTIFKELAETYKIEKVFTNHDYEPYATERDEAVGQYLREEGIEFLTYKDQVIFEKNEILKNDGEPYSIFTPFSRRWKSKLDETALRYYDSSSLIGNFLKQEKKSVPAPEQFGFKTTEYEFPLPELNIDFVRDYEKTRNYPGIEGTSRIGVHLRFGTVSIRKIAALANKSSETFLNELIWREFYQMILWHYPRVVTSSFKPGYDRIDWRNNPVEFNAWCEGKTGYPLVDAGMRELIKTGFMHNRVRMVTASFLTKHLLIDWRWGEAWFAKKLLDYELASNNGGWQWAAGCGCDAAPYFRIFNPSLQAKKFDPENLYIRKWIPELDELAFQRPIVEHEFARERCIRVFNEALKK